MADLEQRMRDWRRETEATLAFSVEELDELEDHLRLSFEAKRERGIAIDQAWNESITGLGASSLLALEFAKEKLMPALGRLLYSWWKPALLCVLYGIAAWLSFDQGREKDAFWIVLGFAFAATVWLVPEKAHKNALLAGAGLSVALLPLLYGLAYNPWTEHRIGPHWQDMGATFGLPVTGLGLLAVIVISTWSRSRAEGKKGSAIATAMLIAILAALPIACEVLGDLCLREMYALPDAAHVRLTGAAQTNFLQSTFVRLLFDSMRFLTVWVPLVVAGIVGGFLLAAWMTSRNRPMPESAVFPSTHQVPPLIMLAAGGLFLWWGLMCSGNFRVQMRQMIEAVPGGPLLGEDGGLFISNLIVAGCLVLSAAKLTQALKHALTVRPFYALLVVALEFAAVLGIADDLAYSNAEIIFAAIAIILLGFAAKQGRFIAQRTREAAVEPSASLFAGADLVRYGLNLGLIAAVLGSPLFLLAIAMAFDSVVYIRALIDWGNSIKNATAFHPEAYITAQPLDFWMLCGPVYLAICLASGLGVVMTASALEFIRFNSYRLYRLRKLRGTVVLAVND